MNDVKQYDCFSTEYDGEKMTWFICSADGGIKDSIVDVVIGEEGEIPVEKIDESFFFLCKQSDDGEWSQWRIKVAKKLRSRGIEEHNIMKEIVKIMFESVKKYKANIADDPTNSQYAISQKKRKFYFLARCED